MGQRAPVGSYSWKHTRHIPRTSLPGAVPVEATFPPCALLLWLCFFSWGCWWPPMSVSMGTLLCISVSGYNYMNTGMPCQISSDALISTLSPRLMTDGNQTLMIIHSFHSTDIFEQVVECMKMREGRWGGERGEQKTRWPVNNLPPRWLTGCGAWLCWCPWIGLTFQMCSCPLSPFAGTWIRKQKLFHRHTLKLGLILPNPGHQSKLLGSLG